MLRGNAPVIQQSTSPGQATQQTQTPQAQQTQSSTPGVSSSGTTPEGIPISQLPPELIWNGQLDVSNPSKQAQYQQIVQQSRQSASASPGSPTSGVSSFINTPTISLPELYEGLFSKSGISNVEKELSDKSKAYTDAVAKIKDNPYLSEATMTGRLRKLDDKFNADTANLRNDIATKKADIETKLNIETKQFDINSTQATQALNQFNSLLQAGALDAATGDDIANITRGTGLSSPMIQSAINANKAKNVQASAATFDDGTNQGFVLYNSKTGDIISKQVISASKPKEVSTSATKNTAQSFIQTANSLNASDGVGVFLQLVKMFAPLMSLQEIYRQYLLTDWGKKFGNPGESASLVNKVYTEARKGEEEEDDIDF